MNKRGVNSNMENYIDNILAENLTLKRKLDSKCEALVILNKELEDSCRQRDEYKLMAEQLQEKYANLKKWTLRHDGFFTDGAEASSPKGQDSREINKALKVEIESLRQKLRDSLGDVKALRSQLNQQKWPSGEPDLAAKKLNQEEELVKQLEAMHKNKNQLEIDLQSILDEKEELVTERDAYKCKVHRLNHEFNMVLKGDNHSLIDLDALIMENRFLQEHLQQVQEEQKLANQTIARYKSIMEKKRSKGSVTFGTNSGATMLLSQKQVQETLENGTPAQIPNTPATLSDLRSLSLALLESLGDKTLALSHQRKANRLLAARISELQQRLESLQGAQVISFPSRVLLEGYVSSDVDKDVAVKFDEMPVRPQLSVASPVVEPAIEEVTLGSEDPLPPQLAELVQKALHEIQLESKTAESAQT